MTTEKGRRQAAILRVVRRHAVASQAELSQELAQAGVRGTQASLSRDIRELGIVKVRGRYALTAPVRGSAPAAPEVPEVEALRAAVPVGANLIIIRTPPGGAPLAASYVDRAGRTELVGSLAGDDTSFRAVRSRADQGRLLAWLRNLGKGRTT
ncbi:MAG: arginine repressor [Candidatus Eisenbacteria bacterium]|nr:arginine repressor [Candidatus Eisenbacteria bacterium]